MAGRLAVLLLKEEFGEIVGCVGNYLVEHGSRALQEIHKGTNLDREQASNLLHMLTKQYQVLDYTNMKEATRLLREATCI